MQAEVSFIVNARWIDQVWYLRTSTLRELQTTTLRIELASRLSPFVSHPASLRPWDSCTSSSADSSVGGKMLRETQNTRSVWGDDVILQTPTLQLTFPALAATYLQVFAIDGTHMLSVIQKFPEVMRVINRICKRWIMRRCFVRAAERVVYGRGDQFRGRLRPIYARDVLARFEAANSLNNNRATVGEGFFRSLNQDFYLDPSRETGFSRKSRSPHKHGGSLRGVMANAGIKKGSGSITESEKQKISTKKRKASVIIAAQTFGLEEMKDTMDARIAAEESADVRIGRIEDRLNQLVGNVGRIEQLLLSQHASGKEQKPADGEAAAASTSWGILTA